MLQAEQDRPSNSCLFPDPLDEDARDDDHIVVTRRRLVRLALVAAETGARFQRDGIAHHPMAWMLAPRRVFSGRAPLDACLDLENCTRALVIHGLCFALDPTVEEVDDLLGKADEDDVDAAFSFADSLALPSRTTPIAPFCAA